MLLSYASASLKQYTPSIRAWFDFCQDKDLDCLTPTKTNLLGFLAKRRQMGDSYSTLGTHRSAVSLLSNDRVGKDLDVSMFIKGVYRSSGVRPRYSAVWDISIVLNYLKELKPDSLLKITMKTVMLLALSTAQRC